MSTYVFVGPTISEDQILSIIPGVNILPPIQRGDLIRLRPHQGDVVLIIDGYFGTKPSIQHMEVIHAIGKGCVVIGCSSMGALRASEMDKVGMIGVGEIYDMYRTGVIDGDDEVAVLHDEENYRTYSEPLVNIRVNLDRAVDKGLLSRELKGKLISNMKRRWFGERTYETLINECRKLPDVNAEDLERFLDLQAIDLKKLDSIRAISLIAETSQWRMPIIQFPLTSFAYHLVQEFNIAGKNKSGHSFTVDDVLNLVRLLFDDFKEAYQEVCVQYHMGQEAVVTDDFFYPLMQPPGVLHTDPLVVLIAQRNWYSYAVKALSQTTRDSSIRKSIAKLEMIYSKHWRVKDWRHEIKLRGFYNAQHFRDTCGKEMILEAIGGVEP